MSEPVKKKIKRSRFGCHRCKKLKIKCSEERPACSACVKVGSACDYSLKLTWGGRPYKNADKRKASNFVPPPSTATDSVPRLTPSSITFVTSDQHPSIKTEDVPPTLSLPSHSGNWDTSNGKILLRPQNDFSPQSTNYNHWPANSVHHPTDSVVDRPTQQDSELLMSFAYSPSHAPSFPSSFPSPVSSNHNHLPIHSLLPQRQHNVSDLNGQSEQTDNATDISLKPMWDQRSFQEDNSDSNLSLSKYLVPPFSPSTFTMQRAHSPQFISEEEVALNTLRSIPPQLSPLPELLLDVPFNRQMFQFWIEKASNVLVPAPSHLYKENPFKVILPQMAMHYPGVLSTMLAFSARLRDTTGGQVANLQEFINQLLSRACSELLKQLQSESEATSDGTLALVLLLSSYEVFNSNDFEKHRTHNTGATQIVSAILTKKKGSSLFDSPDSNDGSPSNSSFLTTTIRDESSVAFFLIRWFIYSDVMGALSSTRGMDKYLRSYRNGGHYKPVETVGLLDESMMGTRSKSSHSTNDIDYFMGFDMRLIPHFVNVGLLIRETEQFMESGGNDKHSLPVWIITAALELKARFLETYLARSETRQAQIDEIIDKKMSGEGSGSKRTETIDELIQHDNILRATNKLYFDMVMLNLYRRVLLIPRLSPIIQDLANEMLEVLEFAVEVGSPAEVCTIFCHFCAGCETLDAKKREFIFERYMKLAGAGYMSATKSLVIMNRCWETGQDWMTAAHELDIDLVLM